MPTPMIHLYIADALLLRGADVGDPGLFCLGSISPDAIHKRPNGNRADKDISHLVVKKETGRDGDAWLQKTLAFYKERRDQQPGAFFLGYCVHLLTDIFWFDEVYLPFAERYTRAAVPMSEKQDAYYNDVDLLDIGLYRTYPRRRDVWMLLEKTPGQALSPLISAEECEAWKKHILGWFDAVVMGRYKPQCYITAEMLKKFMVDSEERIFKLMF